MAKWSKKDYAYFLINTNDFEDALLDAKEDLLDPIKRFMNGEQRNIYDQVKKLLDGNTANFDYIQGDELEILKTLLASNTPYKGNGVQLAKAAKDQLAAKVLTLIDEEKVKATKKAEDLITDITARKEYKSLETAQQQQIITGLEQRKKALKDERFIANIRQSSNQLSELHTAALNLMATYLAKPQEDGKAAEPTTKYIRRSNVHIDFDKKELHTEADVLAYIEAVKEAYLKRINDNIRITL